MRMTCRKGRPFSILGGKAIKYLWFWNSHLIFLRGNFLTCSLDYQELEVEGFKMSVPRCVKFCRKEEQEGNDLLTTSSQWCMLLTWLITDDVHNDLAEAVFPRFLHHKTIFTPPPTRLFGSKSLSVICTPEGRVGDDPLHFLERECPHEEVGILLWGRVIFSVSIQTFISVWT